MRPLRITAKNLRTWEELELDVPLGITAIVGPNGAGKSTLVSAIDLALFGDGRELKRAHSRGAPDDEVAIELELEHAGERYRIRRAYDVRGRGKPSLDFERRATSRHEGEPVRTEAGTIPAATILKTWESLTRDRVDETQALIEDVLGLSRQTFRASSYLAQGDGDAFTSADPRDRKAILLDALGVRLWDQLKELATSRRQGAERAHAGAEAAITAAKARLERMGEPQLAVTQIRANVERIVEELAAQQTELGIARVHLEDAQKTAGERRAREERLRAAVQTSTSAIRRLDELARNDLGIAPPEAADDETFILTLKARAAAIPTLEKYVELDRVRAAAKQNAASADSILEANRRELAEVGAQQDAIGEELAGVEHELAELVVCPTCERPLDEDAKRAAGASLRARKADLEHRQDEVMVKAKRATERLTELEKAADLADREAEELTKELAALPLEDPARTNPAAALLEGRQAERALEKISTTAGLRDQLTAELASARAEEENARAALAELEGPSLEGLAEEVKGREEGIALRSEQLREVSTALARAETIAEEHEKTVTELEEQSARRFAALNDLELYRLAERAYGRDGIPALILETSAIPQLEAEANRIIDALGRDYRFELRTQRETAAGTVKEVLDVIVSTPTGDAAYEDFSGGERARIDVALRIALARLLAQRRGSDVRLLAIDEPAFLDEEGFELLAGVLRELEHEFETILVVSHVEALQDSFDSAIIVGGGADSNEPSRLEEVRGE
jgi:exonuclease SbcC